MNHRISSIAILFVIILTTVFAYQRKQEGNPALDRLYASYEIDEVLFNEKGIPKRISGMLSDGISQTDPVEIIYAFLDDNRELFGIKNPRSEFRAYKVKEPIGDRTWYMVHLAQYINDVKVFRSVVNARINSEKILTSVSIRYFKGEIGSAVPSLSAEDLKMTAAALYDKTVEECRIGEPELVVYPHQDSLTLCWITTVSFQHESWRSFIDAHTGSEIHRENWTFGP
ncbi:hypothetical protein EH220_04505 [bacterium]|nr:MAG: hypothetical protein EH220_04505 [bacterium]